MKTQYADFTLMNSYEYKFPNGLTKSRMEVDDLYVPQQGPYTWDYFLEKLKLQDKLSSDLK